MLAAELSEYLDIQGSVELVTKTELRAQLRSRGLGINDRNLTYYTSVGLLPSAVRIGSRGAAYPKVVIEQAAWVLSSRAHGLSIDAINELLPLWRWLVAARKRDCIDLNEFELIARRGSLSHEANYAVPGLVNDVLHELCSNCLEQLEWVLKDGSHRFHTEETPLTLSFLLGDLDEQGRPRLLAWTQLAFPGLDGVDPNAPTSITLGLPPGVAVPGPRGREQLASPGRACRVKRAPGVLQQLPMA